MSSNINHLLSNLPKPIMDRITGKLLGDANISIEKGRKPRLRFSHCLRDQEWLVHCYNELKDFIPLSEPRKRKINDHRIKSGYTESIYVQSYVSPFVEELKSLWYKERKKVIPFELLHNGISPVLLAWWYQDDGHLKVVNDKFTKIILSTESFTKEENLELINLLYHFYSLPFKLDGQNRIILYEQAQIYYFLSIVKPHLHNSMSRKFIQIDRKREMFASKRTTVYLPKSILLEKPTRDIHKILIISPDLLKLVSNPQCYQQLMKGHYSKIYKETSNGKGYQVTLKSSQLEIISEIQAITGFSLSLIVYMCYLLSIGGVEILLNRN